VRIGIVNDVRASCEALRRVVSSLAGHTVAWIAADGVEAIAMAKRDRPDLILMDLIMPHVDGVQATRQIMATAPCAILVVTATVSAALEAAEAAGASAVAEALTARRTAPLLLPLLPMLKRKKRTKRRSWLCVEESWPFW
jgi:chemotaxis response regulator CheB